MLTLGREACRRLETMYQLGLLLQAALASLALPAASESGTCESAMKTPSAGPTSVAKVPCIAVPPVVAPAQLRCSDLRMPASASFPKLIAVNRRERTTRRLYNVLRGFTKAFR